MNAAAPNRITVRMYQVGFGDCFLISFSYPAALPDGRSERHVLIDFGSTRWPKGFAGRYPDLATDLAARTGGSLDVLVITHRHKDHLGGFGDDAAAATIAGLAPRLVIRGWTEDPKAAVDAHGPALVGEKSLAYANGLESAQAFAGEVVEQLGDRRGFRGELADMALDQLPNQEAINRLDALATGAADGARYLSAGAASGIDDVIPGVTTKTLGPPTVDQWPAVAGQRADDPEYWLLRHGLLAGMLQAVGAPPAAVRAAAAANATPIDPGPIRWIVEQLHEQQTHSLLRIVTTLEDALNNTSVILQFDTGTRRLLFPGDAQIENWSYALTSPDANSLRSDLGELDLYKVGHHGSRNASPRSLVQRWQTDPRKFVAMMSTLPHVHGQSEATAVPRQTLVDALEALGPLFRTDSLDAAQLSTAVGASTEDHEAFAPV